MLLDIGALIESSTKNTLEVKFFVIYEQLKDLKLLPGKGNGKVNRDFKHWKILMEIGFDNLTVEFLENKSNNGQGVVKIEKYTSQSGNDLREKLGSIIISTHRLYWEILAMHFSWNEYSVVDRNCQHFVKGFLERFWIDMTNKTEHAKRIYCRNTERPTLKLRIASFFTKRGIRSRS
ncbi:hypothetical protein EC991_006461 [Linnemannia zychae]|nr:hypothetical protein EC991_006461 [Linnemannia zychae]